MSSKCNEGRYGCKYLGDLPDICVKYHRGSHNGNPIIAWNEFPMLCKECEHRELYWCKFQHDLICFAEQDPYNCMKDLSKDTLAGIELIAFRNQAIEKACEKWSSPITNYRGRTKGT